MEENKKENNEWSLLAAAYEDVLLPRFQPLYDSMADIVRQRILSEHLNKDQKILDIGTGPGEPLLTIYKQISDKINHQVKFLGTDSSETMLLSAKNRCLSLNTHHGVAIDFCTIDESKKIDDCDIITSSLVLPYASKPEQMLKEIFDRLRPGGLLVSSHWPHPSQVPFLGVLKCISYFMANRKRKELYELDSDITFSLWDENKVRQLYEDQGLCIQNWSVVDLPMVFPNIRCLLSFCRIANWFHDLEGYFEAEQETLRILKDNFKLELQADTSFELPSKVIVVSASR